MVSGSSSRSIVVTVLVWTVLLAIPGALVGGGGWLLYQRAAGTRVEATVLDCDLTGGRRGGYRQRCVAEWTVGGERVVGRFVGGNGDGDVGRTVPATVRGDTAYSRSLTLPVLLIALGLPFLFFPVSAMRTAVRRRQRRAGPGGPASRDRRR